MNKVNIFSLGECARRIYRLLMLASARTNSLNCYLLYFMDWSRYIYDDPWLWKLCQHIVLKFSWLTHNLGRSISSFVLFYHHLFSLPSLFDVEVFGYYYLYTIYTGCPKIPWHISIIEEKYLLHSNERTCLKKYISIFKVLCYAYRCSLLPPFCLQLRLVFHQGFSRHFEQRRHVHYKLQRLLASFTGLH